MTSRWGAVCVTAALGLVGCDASPGWLSDGELVVFDDPTVRVGAERIGRGDAVVGGSVLCPVLRTVPQGADGWIDLPESYAYDCFDHTIGGATFLDDPMDGAGGPLCLRVDDAAESLVWSLTPRSCRWSDSSVPPVADGTALSIVPADAVRGRLVLPVDDWAERNLVSVDAGALVAAAPLSDATVAVHVAGFAGLGLGLEVETGAVGLVWDPAEGDEDLVDGRARLRVVSVAGPAPAIARGETAPTIRVAVDEGSVSRLEWVFDGRVMPIAQVEAVTTADLGSVEVVVAHEPGDGEADEPGAPVGARAVVRTHDGRLVFGAPVHWAFEGEVQEAADMSAALAEVGPDYIALEPSPAEASGLPAGFVLTGTVRASIGDLEGGADLAWAWPEDAPRREEQGTACTFDGAACAAACPGSPFRPRTAGAGGLLFWPVVLGSFALRRRRWMDGSGKMPSC